MWADGDEQRPDVNLTVQLLLHSLCERAVLPERFMTPSGVNMRYNGSSLVHLGLLHSLLCVRLWVGKLHKDICLPALIFNSTYFSKKELFQTAFIAVTFYAVNDVRVGHIEM